MHVRPGVFLLVDVGTCMCMCVRVSVCVCVCVCTHPQEENARAGVLLEQSAYCLLFTAPPSVRKFAFHMVLAALRYNSGGFKRLALHCYK